MFRVCPLINVTQREPGHGEWRARTDAEEAAGKSKKARQKAKRKPLEPEPEPTFLGSFRTWVREAAPEPAWLAPLETFLDRVAAPFANAAEAAEAKRPEWRSRVTYMLRVAYDRFVLWRRGTNSAHPFHGANRYDLAAASGPDGASQLYDGGQPCGGTPRAVFVRPTCGPETRVVRVDEDGTCLYLIDLETPAACAPGAAAAARSELAELERREAAPLFYASRRNLLWLSARLRRGLLAWSVRLVPGRTRTAVAATADAAAVVGADLAANATVLMAAAAARGSAFASAAAANATAWVRARLEAPEAAAGENPYHMSYD